MFQVILAYGQDAKKMFLESPESITLSLTKTNRADFIDFLESNMKAQVKNRFGSTSEMTDLTADYIRIQLTTESSWEMKVLSLNDTTKIICTVSTVCAPACDSRILFYDENWKPLELSTYLRLPVKEDFFLPYTGDSAEDYQVLYKKADLFLVKVMLSKDSNKISFQYTTPDYMLKEDADELTKYLKQLDYNWREGKYQPSSAN